MISAAAVMAACVPGFERADGLIAARVGEDLVARQQVRKFVVWRLIRLIVLRRGHSLFSLFVFRALDMHTPPVSQLANSVNRRANVGRLTARMSSSRAGFTLVEILIVMAILAVLIALLVPAIGAVRRRVTVGAVKAEISQLESAIGQFKALYGVEPPSRVLLCESLAGWTDPTNAWTTSRIRRVWPSFDFSIARDLNSDGDTTDTIELCGSEALVFFLGGMATRSSSTSAFVLNGFSKNPANPLALGGNREGPFIEFSPGRIQDTINPIAFVAPTATLTPVYFPEYIDSIGGQTTPYIYFANFDGQGYLADPDIAAGSPWRARDAKIAPGIADSSYLMTRMYVQSNPSDNVVTAGRTLPNGTTPHKPQSFQIISPGFDTRFGRGGLFDPTKGQSDHTALLSREDFDNITNFTAAELLP